MIVLAVQVSFVTSIRDFKLFILWQLAIGVTSGAGISGCEAWILDIWGEDCAPYMQALQLFRGLGYILGPIMAEPFLAPELDKLSKPSTHNITAANHTAFTLPTNLTTSEPEIISTGQTRIFIPYLINGCMIGLGGVIIFTLYYFFSRNDKSSKTKEMSQSNLSTVSSQATIISCISKSTTNLGQFDRNLTIKKKKKSLPKPYTIWIISLCSIFYLFFFEEVVVTYLASFASNVDLKLTKSQGAYLTSTFNLANIFGN